VTADTQSTLVRLLNDDGHEFRFHGAVDLDLHIAEVSVIIDALPGFLGSRCENLDRAFEWPGAVDESGQTTRGPICVPASIC